MGPYGEVISVLNLELMFPMAGSCLGGLLDLELDDVDGRLAGKGGKAQSRLEESCGDGGRANGLGIGLVMLRTGGKR